MRKPILAFAAVLMLGGAAHADPILGTWKTQSGATAAIASCGAELCITLQDGQHAGKRIGTFSPNGANAYAGKITDPQNDKSYTGKATLSGNGLKMGGCVLGGLICRSENWVRL